MTFNSLGKKRKWWRNNRLDTWRRKVSHLIFVEYPHDLLPVVPQPQITPPISVSDVALLLEAAQYALVEDLTPVAELLATPEDARYVTLWPGEHYRLLAGIARVLRPSLAIEVGTYKGAAAAVMSAHCGDVLTFDITPIEEVPHSIADLTERFPNVSQVIGDLIEDPVWRNFSGVFEEAGLVFIDGPKDGYFEHVVVPKILERMKPGSVMVLDDIRFAGMRELWASGISQRRVDIGCLGHWSGTGVIFV